MAEDLQKNHSPLFTFFLSLILLFRFNFPFSVSADYSLPKEHFINCGSSDSVTVGSTVYVGDSRGNAAFYFTSRSTSTDQISSGVTTPLNQTARIFKASNSSYGFKITNNGTLHFVRLHFYAFSSAKNNLSEAVFHVSVPGRTLLSNFSIGGGDGSKVEEFLIRIDGGEFNLLFSPVGVGSSNFAFVNAIEVFALPDGFIPVESPTVSPQGPNGNSTGDVTSQVLHTKYSVNVGGSLITPDLDTLLRNWTVDNQFLRNPEAATLALPLVKVSYQPELTNVSNFTAPSTVYGTARKMNVNSSSDPKTYPNITWGFNVSANSKHLVRFHFCDQVSISKNTLSMTLYIFSSYSQTIDPFEDNLTYDLKVPFKYDFVVESEQDGSIQISIGNSSLFRSPENAYLNGLEIMEMIGTWNNSASVFSKPNDKKPLPLIIGLSVGGFVLLCLFILVSAFKWRKKPKDPSEPPSIWSPLAVVYGLGSTHGGRGSDPSVSSGSPFNLHLGLIIPLPDILSATKNFNEKLLIGRGGFGNVYSGTLRNGTKVAVKRSNPGSSQGLLEFQTEIIVLSKIRHKHLVSLIGYCCERSEMILVYEFMEKGTLRDHLYGSDHLELPPLPWKERLEICIGAARGLHYLHKGAAGGIIHRDVKSTNILLDDNFIAKVADFGLSKLGENLEGSHVSTGFKGTFGYLDPEYLKTQQLTEKSDVYAFGVVLLEVLCARPAIDPLLPREQMNLAEWGTANIHKGLVEEIIDPSIASEINPNSLRKFAETALKCLQEDDQDRPHMGDVLWDLEYALQLQKTSAPKGFLEESATNGSSMLGFSDSAIQKIPSMDMSIVETEASMVIGTEVVSGESEVFSQLQGGGGGDGR